MREPAEGFVEANGVRAHWLRWEAVAGEVRPPLLLLHATGFLGRLRQPMAKVLASRVHRIGGRYEGAWR